MPRRSRSIANPTLAAAVRAYFGLTQAELAAFVGASQQLLAAVEAGRKTLGPGPDQRLLVLARQLPPPDGMGPPAPAFAEVPPAEVAASAARLAPAELADAQRRLARCRWLRFRLAFELGQQRGPGQARHQRRQWAVQVLGPVLAAPLPVPDWLAPGGPGPLPPYPLATPDAARDTYWLDGLALHLAATSPPLSPAAALLARARLAGLDAEIALLATHLDPPAAG